MNLKAILFDFDGVLCHDKFYEKTLLPEYAPVYDWLQSNIFGDKELVKKWMRNEVSTEAINRLIAENTGIGFESLTKLFEDSVRQMELNLEIMKLAEDAKLSGKKIAIVTDNMEIFSRITVPHHGLDSIFDFIINSADQGCLKKDAASELFDIVQKNLQIDYRDCLLIDDSAGNIDLFKQKGGQGHVYGGVAGLKSFLYENNDLSPRHDNHA